MKCIYCGKWAGLFKTVHRECAEKWEEEQQERIAEKRSSLDKEISSIVMNFFEGKVEINDIKSFIYESQKSPWLIPADLASIFSNAVNNIIIEYNISSIIKDDFIMLKRLRTLEVLFADLNISNNFYIIVCALYAKIIRLYLDETISISDSLSLTSIIRDLFNDNNELYNSLFREEEQELLRWSGENISERNLLITDKTYKIIETYIEQYNQTWFLYNKDCTLVRYAQRLSYAYILYKLHKKQYIEDAYQLDRAKEHIILKRGEKLVWVIDKTTEAFLQKTRASYVGKSDGMSIRIAKGLSVRTGIYETCQIEDKERKYLGCGDLAFTTMALVFFVSYDGGNSIRIPYEKIVSIKSVQDGFVVEQDGTKKTIQFEIDDWSNEDYYFILSVMQNEKEEYSTSREKAVDVLPKITQYPLKSVENMDDLSKNIEGHPYLYYTNLSRLLCCEKLFNKEQIIVGKIYSFIKNNCLKKEFKDILFHNKSVGKDISKRFFDAIFFRELLECIHGIGSNMEISNPHSSAMLIAFRKTQGIPNFPGAFALATFTKEDIHFCSEHIQDMVSLCNSTIYGLDTIETFIISDIYSYYDKERQLKYIDLMIDFTMCLVEIKNFNSEKSAKFIRHLQDIKSINKGNLIEDSVSK